MTFRAENEADYIKWSIYFRKQMDKRSVRVQVNVVEYRTAILGVMMVLAVWTLLYLDEVVVMEFLNKYHKGLSLLCAGLIFVVFVNRFTSGAVADVINLIPFGVIENSMMFINMVILAIFTFFYDETFGSYFKNSCLTGDAAVAPAPGDMPIDAQANKKAGRQAGRRQGIPRTAEGHFVHVEMFPLSERAAAEVDHPLNSEASYS